MREKLTRLCLQINEFDKKRFSILILVAYGVLYFAQVCLLWGKYSFDEFYALGNLDVSFITRYDRQFLINIGVRIASYLFGNNYYAGKSVALVCGIISFYYCNKILHDYSKKNIYSILLLLIFLFNAYISFNHCYVRFYVLEEMCFSAISYYLLRAYKDNIINYLMGTIFVLLLMFGIKDSSKYIILVAFICTIIISFINRKKLLPRWVYFAVIILMCINSLVFTIFKIKIIRNEIIESYVSDLPVFFLFSITTLLVYYIAYIIYALAIKKSATKYEDIVPLVILTFVPVCIYSVFFNKYSVLRTFTPYIPTILVFTLIILSRIENKKMRRILVVLLLITQVVTFDRVSIIRQWTSPIIKNECMMFDYGAPAEKLSIYQEKGFKTMAVVAMVQHTKVIDFGRACKIYMVDDNNHLINDANIINQRIKEYMDDNTAVYIDNYCISKIKALNKWNVYIKKCTIEKYDSGVIITVKTKESQAKREEK